MFVSVLWYRNVSSEVAGGLGDLLVHKTKIARLTVDLSHMYLACRGMLQQWTRLGYKMWTEEKKESSRNFFSCMFKTTQNCTLCRYRLKVTETRGK